MSLDNCIPALTASGDISPDRAAEIQAWYDERKAHWMKQIGPAEAAARASAEVTEGLSAAAKQAKRRKLLAMKAQLTIIDDLKRFRNPEKIVNAMQAFLVRDDRAPYANAGKQAEVIRARAQGHIREILEKHHQDFLTGAVRDKAGAEDILREIMGTDTGNVAAKRMAEAWTSAGDMLRQRFNAAGGQIGKLEGGWFPQSHDSVKVKSVTKADWIASIAPKLDRARMIDQRTGHILGDQEFMDALDEVYDRIATDGWNRREPGSYRKTAMANRHADHRFLHFKSANDWLAYNADFGAHGPFDAMMSHIESMSRDIALMERFGPNPADTIRWMKDLLIRQSHDHADDAIRANAERNAGNLQSLYDELAGTREPTGNETVARFASGVRQFEASAKLGGAVLSAFSDTGFGLLTRAFNGLPMTGIARDYLRTFSPGSSVDRELAMYLGFGAQELAGHGVAQMRLFNEQVSGPMTHWLAERTMRLSGLSRWTGSGQWANGFGIVTHITMERNKTFDQLHPRFAAMLERYGLGASAWDHIRATELEEHRGVPFIVPTRIEDQAIGDALIRMIVTEADFATPVVDLRTREQVNSALPRGRALGEIGRSSLLLFKTFGLSIWATHGRRMLEMDSNGGRAAYFAGMMALTTGAAAISLWMKDIKDGKDPRDAQSPEFWAQAMAQAGGLGPLGDYLNSAVNSSGAKSGSYFAGPVLGTLGDVTYSIADNIKRAWNGDPEKPAEWGKDAVRIGKGNVPVASSLWYTRLAFEHYMVQTLQAEADPDHQDAWRRMGQFAEEQGTQYYWEPGAPLSDARAPDMSNIWDRPE